MKKFVQNLRVILLFSIVVSSNTFAQDQLNVLIELSNASSWSDSIETAEKYGFKLKFDRGKYVYKNKKSYIQNIDGDLFMWIPYSRITYKTLKKELDLSYLLWNIAPEKNVILSEIQYDYSNHYFISLFLDWYGRKNYIFVVLSHR